MRLLVVLLLGLGVCAQSRTWIVDAANGAGTDFIDIPPAIAAAADADTVLVRAGTYRGFSIAAKDVRVLADGGAAVAIRRPADGSSLGVVEVHGLTARQSTVLRGLQIIAADGQRGVDVAECAGRVHLESVRVTTEGLAVPAGVRAADTSLLTITDSAFTGYPALRAASVRVHVTKSNLAGGASYVAGDGAVPGAPALELLASQATFASTRLTGGSGSLFPFGAPLSAPAVRADASALIVAGNNETIVEAGQRLLLSTPPASAVVATGGLIEIDSTVQVVPNSGAPPIVGPSIRRPTVLVEAAMSAGSDVLSGAIRSRSGDLMALFAGAPTVGVPTPLGTLLVAQWFSPISGTPNTGNRLPFNLRIPAVPTLVRAPAALQAINLYAADHTFELSNVVVLTLFP